MRLLRLILLISLGVNLALGLVWYFSLRHPVPTSLVVAAARPRPHVTRPTNSVRTHVVVRRQFFTWAEVESSDYPTYIANLRAIGCPESTIRDIIVAEVNQFFARRRATEIAGPEDQWWRSAPDPAAVAAAEAKRKALDDERRGLLTRLLGPGWEVAGNPASVAAISLAGPVLGDLSPEVKQTVLSIAARAREQEQAYLDAQAKAGTSPDPAELARIQLRSRADLAKVLTPDQLEEYLLRYSSTATGLRAELAGVNVTPDEFRTLFRACDGIDSQIQLQYSGDDPLSIQRRQELEQQRDTLIKETLDPDQYHRYQLARDPAYRQAQATVAQIGASPDKALPLYQINQLSATERQRILNDPTLTDQERDGALQLVQDDLNKSLQRLLGSDAFQQYQRQQKSATNTPSPTSPLLPPQPNPAPTQGGSPGQ